MAASTANPQSVSNGSLGASTITLSSYVVPAGNNKKLFVGISCENNPATSISSVTFDGNAMTEIFDNTHSAGFNSVAAYTYDLGSTTPTGDIVVTFSGTTTVALVGALTLINVADTPEASNSVEDAASPTSVSLTTLTDNALLVDVYGGGQNVALSKTEANQVEEIAIGVGGSTGTLGMSSEVTTSAGSYTFGWSAAGNARMQQAIFSFAEDNSVPAVDPLPVKIDFTKSTLSQAVIKGDGVRSSLAGHSADGGTMRNVLGNMTQPRQNLLENSNLSSWSGGTPVPAGWSFSLAAPTEGGVSALALDGQVQTYADTGAISSGRQMLTNVLPDLDANKIYSFGFFVRTVTTEVTSHPCGDVVFGSNYTDVTIPPILFEHRERFVVGYIITTGAVTGATLRIGIGTLNTSTGEYTWSHPFLVEGRYTADEIKDLWAGTDDGDEPVMRPRLNHYTLAKGEAYGRRKIVNLFDQDLRLDQTTGSERWSGSWTASVVGGTITPGPEPIGTPQTTVIACGSSERAWEQQTEDVVSGRTYALSVEVAGYSNGGLSTNVGLKVTGQNLATISSDGRWVFVWTPSVTETATIQIGCGINAGVNAACGMTISKPMLEDITDDTSVHSDYVQRSLTSTSYAANTAPASGSIQIVAAGTPTPHPANSNKYSFGLCVGDSFANDNFDWPTQLSTILGNSANDGLPVIHAGEDNVGEEIDAIQADFEIAADNYDYDFAVLQGGFNNINSGDTAAETLTAMQALASAATDRGMAPIIHNVAPGTSESAEFNRRVREYNGLLFNWCQEMGYPYVDIWSALRDPASEDDMLAEFDLDGTHPNSDGGTLSAWLVFAALENKSLTPVGLRRGIAATNLLLSSEDLSDTGVYTTTNAVVLNNSGRGAGGGRNAIYLQEDGTTGVHSLDASVTKAASALQYYLSAYCRAGQRQSVTLRVDDGAAGNAEVTFDLKAGTAGSVTVNSFTGGAASISYEGNGLYRCALSFTTTTATTLNVSYRLNNGSTTSYAGDDVSGLFMHSLMLSQSSILLDYVQSTDSAKTRAADLLKATDVTDIGSSPTAISVIAEVSGADIDAYNPLFYLSDGTANNALNFAVPFDGSNVVGNEVVAASASQGSSVIAAADFDGSYSVGFSLEANDNIVVRDQTLGNNDTTVTLPTGFTQLEFGNALGVAAGQSNIKRLRVWLEALSDADLQNPPAFSEASGSGRGRFVNRRVRRRGHREVRRNR
ncbi:MAG: SGNH/GDSL hydrolase family protein [Pikeienuella sp.]